MVKEAINVICMLLILYFFIFNSSISFFTFHCDRVLSSGWVSGSMHQLSVDNTTCGRDHIEAPWSTCQVTMQEMLKEYLTKGNVEKIQCLHQRSMFARREIIVVSFFFAIFVANSEDKCVDIHSWYV